MFLRVTGLIENHVFTWQRVSSTEYSVSQLGNSQQIKGLIRNRNLIHMTVVSQVP